MSRWAHFGDAVNDTGADLDVFTVPAGKLWVVKAFTLGYIGPGTGANVFSLKISFPGGSTIPVFAYYDYGPEAAESSYITWVMAAGAVAIIEGVPTGSTTCGLDGYDLSV